MALVDKIVEEGVVFVSPAKNGRHIVIMTVRYWDPV